MSFLLMEVCFRSWSTNVCVIVFNSILGLSLLFAGYNVYKFAAFTPIYAVEILAIECWAPRSG